MRSVSSSRRAVRVVIVRHGPAESRDPVRWPNDDMRPLSRKGRSQTKKAAKTLANLARPVSRVVSSGADRAISTAALLAEAFPKPPRLETWPELAPGNFPAPLFSRISRSVRPGQELVVVGHEPTLAEFVGMAIEGDELEVVHLTKGGAACLEFPDGVRPGAGRLLWLYTRKQLAKRDS